MARYVKSAGGNAGLYSPSAGSLPTIANALPFSMAAWIWLSGTSGQRYVTAFHSSTLTWYYGMYISDSDNLVNAGVWGGGSAGIATSSIAVAAGKWVHVAGVFDSDSSRVAYVSGIAGTVNTTYRDSTWFDNGQASVGCFYSSSTYYYPLVGSIAHAAFWTTALTSSEVLRLSQGVSPLAIRGQALKLYYPLDEPRGWAFNRCPSTSGKGNLVSDVPLQDNDKVPASCPDPLMLASRPLSFYRADGSGGGAASSKMALSGLSGLSGMI